MAARQFRVSLAAMPDIRTAGAFAGQEEHIAWVQPSDLWHVHWPSHEGVFSMNGRSFDFRPHAVIVVPPGARCEVQRTGRDIYVYCYFSFAPKESGGDFAFLPVVSQLEPAQADWLEREFRRCLNHQQWSRAGLKAIAYAFLWSIAQPEFVHAKASITEAAEQIIEARLGGRIRIKELAEELQVSQSQLARAFLHDHGRTPLQFVRDRRAQLAYRLLRRTATPIKQIAFATGFPDSNQFYRFIKERYGASPREIRRERRNMDVFQADDLRAARHEDGVEPRPKGTEAP